MAELVFTLCTLTSGACAVLLLRQYRRARLRLALLSGVCFATLMLNNALLLLGEIGLVYSTELARNVPPLIGVSVLLANLIWDQA